MDVLPRTTASPRENTGKRFRPASERRSVWKHTGVPHQLKLRLYQLCTVKRTGRMRILSPSWMEML